MRIFVDSGGWLSVLVRTDQHHVAGSAYYRQLLDAHARLFTSDFVLDEVITRLRYDIGHATASHFISLIQQSVNNHALQIWRVDEVIWQEAEKIFLQYADVRLSFTDCTSFALLNIHPVDEVFGFDQHFTIMGWVLKP